MNSKIISIFIFLFTILLLVNVVNALEFYFNESTNEESVTASSYRNKTNITFILPTTANYTIIATAEINHSSGGAGEYVGARLVIDNVAYHEILYRPKDVTDWFPFAAIKQIELNTSQHSINIQWNATSTGFIRNARIFVMQVDAQYNESEGVSTTSSTTPVEKAKLNFTPASAGNYLIVASANIQNSANGRAAAANLYVSGTGYMQCEYEQRDTRNRYGCATMKNLTLNASQTIINLTFNVNNVADTATIKNAHLIAIRLDTFNRTYYNESESETTPAAADTWYNKTVNVYTSTPGRHLIIGSIEQQATTANSNRVGFYNGTTAGQNSSVEATAASDWTTFVFITVANLTAGSQTDRIEHSATGGALSNFGVKSGRLLSILIENSTPIMSSLSASPSPIKGGGVVTITGNNIDDPNGQTLNIYCSESSTAPTSSNTICTGGTTVDTTRPYNLTCTYATATDDATHTAYCRVFDGDFYSNVTNTTYITDSTPPSTTVNNVAGDTAATYYDNVNDGWTNISVDGETNMVCRWGTSDVVYSTMSNDCIISGSQATCSAVTTTQGLDAYNFYASCQDSLGNSQNTSQNLDITALVHDWTAPTTSDNSSATIQIPPYIVAITESDNLAYGTANIQTKSCTDTSGSCTPSTSIDDGGTITFTSSNRGINFLRYNSSDPAGNIQSIQNKTININQLPIFTSSSDNATTIGGGYGVLITTVTSDADSGQILGFFVCNSTSATSAGCTHTTYCSNTTATANASCSFTSETDDTTHTWYAFLYDSLNESSTINASGTYTTDSTAPTITIINPENRTFSENSVSIQLSTSETTNWAGYSLDEATNVTMGNSTPTFWSATISGLSNGSHTLRFYANDSYGNMGTNNRSFSIDTTLTDTTGPTITVFSPTNTTFTSTSILLNITLSEDGNSAVYSLDDAANASLGNTSLRNWNATVTMSQAVHNIRFYANDTSINKNTGNSSVTYFTVDATAPQNSTQGYTPSSVNETIDVTCFALWTDTLGLDSGIVQHNETGTDVNATQIALSGTSGWTNLTISSTTIDPGTIQCKFYAFDKGGLVNTTTVIIPVADVIAPRLENITYSPNVTDDIDPNVLINVTADVQDNVSVSRVILQYSQTNATDWTNVTMSLGSGNRYNGSFTPALGNWSFRIYANDTSNNINTSSITNITIDTDKTWNNVTTLSSIKTIVKDQSRVINLGNLTINNTGDFDLNFTINSSQTWITFNNTGSNSINFIVNQSRNASLINVTANTTGFAVGEYNFNITIYAFTINPTLVSTQTISGKVVIQNVAGPFFTVTITNYDATVTQGDTGVILTTTLSNDGTIDATGTWLNWTLPSGWTNTSGMLNKFIGFLGVGSTVTNSITISISSSASIETQTITASTGSNENITGSDSKSVTVSSLTPTSSAPSAPSAGGGGGVPAPTAWQKALLFQTNETFELVRGLNDTFIIKVENPFKGSKLTNITLNVTGFLAQYIIITPELIGDISYNESAFFKITITVPTYFTKGSHNLNFTIKGKLTGALATTLTENRAVTLTVHEVSRQEANSTIELSNKYFKEMLDAGFPSKNVRGLLGQSDKAFEERDYEKVKEITGLIALTRDTAFSTHKLIQEVQNNIKTAEDRGLKVDETKNLLNLAVVAFEREDYPTAQKRIKEAQLVYGIETIGKVNFLKIAVDYWWVILLITTVATISGMILYRRMIVVIIARKLNDLIIEEININELMKETQRKTYVEKTMSSMEYHKAMAAYEKRLSKIKETRIKLRAKEVGIIKISKEHDNLKKEDQNILNFIQETQRDYFERRTISKDVYTKRMEAYKLRKTEIEEGLATLEAKLTKEMELEKLGLGLKTKIKKLLRRLEGRKQ